jgi:hypothetical protein
MITAKLQVVASLSCMITAWKQVAAYRKCMITAGFAAGPHFPVIMHVP